MIGVLRELFILRGTPAHIRSDNGPEFIASAVRDWLEVNHVGPLFIEPGVSGAKYALSRLGKIENVVRSPLVTVEEGTAERIDAAMRHAGLLN